MQAKSVLVPSFVISDHARQLGRVYARQLRVQWGRISFGKAEASVRGTRVYYVSFSYDLTQGLVESAHCSCPAYNPRFMCKHVAAAYEGLEEALRKTGYLLVKGPPPANLAGVSHAPGRGTPIAPPSASPPATSPAAPAALGPQLVRLLGEALPPSPPSSHASAPPAAALPPDLYLVIDRSPQEAEYTGVHAFARIRFLLRKVRTVPVTRAWGRLASPFPHGTATTEVVEWAPFVVALLDVHKVAGEPFADLVRELFLRCHKSQAKPNEPWKFVVPRKAHALSFTTATFRSLFERLLESGRFVITDTTVACDARTQGLPLRLGTEEVEPCLRIEPDLERLAAGGGAVARGVLELRRKEDAQTVALEMAENPANAILSFLGFVAVGDSVVPLPPALGSPETIRALRNLLERPLSLEDVRSLQDALAESASHAVAPLRTQVPPELLVPFERGVPSPRIILNPGRAMAGLAPGRVFFDYGPHAVSPLDAIELLREVEGTETKRLVKRDREKEQEILNALARHVSPIDGDDGATYGFPSHRLRAIVSALHGLGFAFELDGRKFVHKAMTQLVFREKRDWFEISGGVTFGSDTDESLESDAVPLDRILRAIVEGHQVIEVGDGRVALLPEDLERALRPLLRTTAKGTRSLEANALRTDQFAFLLPALESVAGTLSFEGRAAEMREALRCLGFAPVRRPPPAFKGTLRPYQAEGVEWLGAMGRIGLGVCLADDMGLGKTVQVIAHLSRLRVEARLRALLVAPRSLIENWKRECARFLPSLRVVDISTPHRDLAAGLRGDGELFLTTYALCERDIERLRAEAFDLVLLDEAQNVKNPDTKSARAVRSLQARHRVVLTGTPVENGLGDLASLMRFLNPGVLELETPLRALAANARSTAEVKGLEDLVRSLKPFLLRRTKAQVLKDLPPRIETVVHCALTPAQANLYRRAAEEFRLALSNASREKGGIHRIKIEVIHALLRLRQIACHPRLVHQGSRAGSGKFEYVLERLETLVAERRKVLLFSQFTSLLALLAREFDERNWKYETLDGSTRNRAEVIDSYARSKSTSLFLLSLKAGGVGLNLTMADTVFVLDPWWNPAAEAQAIDRAHRIGQTQAVHAYRLVAKGTVEEKILTLQGEKKELADAILSGSTSALSALSAADLAFLLE